MTRPKRLQERTRRFDHNLNLTGQGLYEVDSARGIAPIAPGTVAYQWCYGLSPLHLHVGDWLHGGTTGQFCIRLQRAEVGEAVNDDRSARFGHCGKAIDDRGGLRVHHIQRSVLVEVIQFLQNGEGLQSFPFRTNVRLQPIEDCHEWPVLAQQPEMPEVPWSDWVGQDFLVRRGVNSCRVDGGPVDEMVQGRAKVVDAVSEEQRPSIHIGKFLDAQVKGDDLWIRVTLNADSIGVSGRMLLELGKKQMEMFLSSVVLPLPGRDVNR